MGQKFTPIVVQAPQRSEEWFRARLGNVTASKVTCVMDYYAVTKTDIKKALEYYALNSSSFDPAWLEKMAEEYPAEFCLRAGVELREKSTRSSYRQNIVAERITGMRSDSDPYVTEDMRWGIINEMTARNIYQEQTGNKVREAYLMMHPQLLCGASPDGLVIDGKTGELGTLEIKCLKSSNHLYKVIRDDAVPPEHLDQIQMQMWMTDRDWCDFVAYDSRVIDGLQLFIKRVEYDEFYVENVMLPMLERFLDECDQEERRFYAIAKARKNQPKEAELVTA